MVLLYAFAGHRPVTIPRSAGAFHPSAPYVAEKNEEERAKAVGSVFPTFLGHLMAVSQDLICKVGMITLVLLLLLLSPG